jgi:hypothetical protein
MYDSVIGLDKGDSVTVKTGEILVFICLEQSGELSVSAGNSGYDDIQITFNDRGQLVSIHSPTGADLAKAISN